jgi:hypothetical protein
VWVGGEALARHDLAAEVIELRFREAALEEGAGVDAGCAVALVVDLVAHALGILAAEEVVEADLVEARGRGERGQVPADAGRGLVGPQHHGRRVPAHHAADAQLHRLVARERRFLLRADGVDVARLRQGGQADVDLPGALEELVEDELGALAAELLGEGVEGRHPVGGFVRIRVGREELEVGVLVDHLGRIVGDAPRPCPTGPSPGLVGVSCCR